MEEIIGLEYTDVMVLYYHGEDDLAGAWCKERGWQYHDARISLAVRQSVSSSWTVDCIRSMSQEE